MAIDWMYRFLEMAELVSTWSKDPSTKVGAVITRDKKIISTGFNGFPPRIVDKEIWWNDRPEKYRRVVHAEMNAILHAKEDLSGCVLHVYPIPPCEICVPMVIASGITAVVYPTIEHSRLNFKPGLKILQEAGVRLFYREDYPVKEGE